MPTIIKRTSLLLACTILTSLANALDNYSTPVSFFYSRPDLLAPAMDVTVSKDNYMENEYVFFTPYQEDQAGPYIYDKQGNLVWSGWAESGPWNAHNLYPCNWRGDPHLCMYQGVQQFGYSRGHGVILNQDYKIVKTVETVGEVVPMDQHEFRLTPNEETFLVSAYQQVPYDLSPLGIQDTIGWVMDGIFQEINATDNTVIFQWSALNHVDPWESYVYPQSSDISGTGREAMSPWDFFHLNSVVKSALTGNYLISARHMGTLFYINATDGSIIWRFECGGRSDFVCDGFSGFAFQHDAEIQSENATTMLITLFDNASNTANKTNVRSEGRFIKLDLVTKRATQYRNPTYFPDFDLLADSQGNMQVLNNGNTFHGWGSWPRFTEHVPDGSVIWEGSIGPRQGFNMIYRVYTGNWQAIPSHTKPALWTYSQTSDAMIAFYVSWNGCTEVKTWNFYGANDMQDDFAYIGSVDRMRRFETVYSSEMHFVYTFAEAIGFDGRSLRNSSMQLTFVPSPALAASCTEMHCGAISF